MVNSHFTEVFAESRLEFYSIRYRYSFVRIRTQRPPYCHVPHRALQRKDTIFFPRREGVGFHLVADTGIGYRTLRTLVRPPGAHSRLLQPTRAYRPRSVFITSFPCFWYSCLS